MKRGSYAAVAATNAPLLSKIRALKAEHPFWGYRRIWAHLSYIDGLTVGKNRVYRLMKKHNLLVAKNMKIKASRRANTSKPKARRPHEWWGIDMTKVMIDGYGWVYVTVVIDWHTKKIVGHHAGEQSKAWHWLVALNKGVNRQFPSGVRGHDLHLMSDNGCQPTSLGFMKACRDMEIKQAFTSYNNPKGNADTERFMRTLKEELVWINEWKSPTAFYKALDAWLEHYNSSYLHSTLGYKTPATFEADAIRNQQNQHQTNRKETLLKNAC